MKIWDRLQQKYVNISSLSEATIQHFLLGQWQVVADDETVKINDVYLENNSRNFLVPDSTKRWTIWNNKIPLSNTIPTWQIPVDIAADSLAFFAKQHTKMLSQDSKWQDWANFSPLIPEIDSAIQVQALEKDIASSIPHLEEVCYRPRSYLKMETEKLPVAKVQRIDKNAISYLTSHTEDWECKTFRGIRPKNVLSLVREELLDIYENRVTVRLIDHVLFYLTQRIRDVEKLKNELYDVLNFTDLSQSIYWRNRDRIYYLWGENFEASQQLKVAESTSAFLRKIKQRFLALIDTDLYKAIPRNAQVEATLRNTNILVGDRHYREVAKLWRQLSKWRSRRTKTAQQLFDFYQQIIAGFDAFCCLLCSKVLTINDHDYGCGFSSDSTLPQQGLSYSLVNDSYGQNKTLNFKWSEDGSIEIQSDELGSLHFIPLVAQLLESADETVIDEILDCLRQKVNTNSQNKKKIILYFGTAQDLSRLSSRLGKYLNTIGNELINDNHKLPLLPVSPFDILSIERVARAIQWWMLSQNYMKYPIKIKLNFPDELLTQNQTWICKTDQRGEFKLLRPLLENEKATFLRDLRRMTRQAETSGYHKRAADLSQLLSLPDDVLQIYKYLITCPTCNEQLKTSEIQFNFTTLKNNCFTSNCQNCDSEWGLQICGNCSEKYPYIQVSYSEPILNGVSVGWIDSVFGRNILAIPRLKDSRVNGYICPWCGDFPD